jgi:hypothetical protein
MGAIGQALWGHGGFQQASQSVEVRRILECGRGHLRIGVKSLSPDGDDANLANWISLARMTRSRIFAGLSGSEVDRISLQFTAGTSMWMSIRSRSGPEILDRER